ncbi:hypothetical protein B0A48_11152 [Cryoendolithus antarcticus]|uniref:Uncharacterized protein n=1 Tax=Cryoendolithus antarcticus TaxID=1507870 RepID=A0A1V8SUX1_9PEZI|nr:hypothetical protein B0A48_11152 [Cryoendolithus antarcticus]
MDTSKGAQMRINRSAAGEHDHSQYLHSCQAESTDAPMPWAMPSAVAVAVFEDYFLDTAGLEASWGFQFTPTITTAQTARTVEAWSNMEDDDSDMRAMAASDVSGLETSEGALTFVPGSEHLEALGAPTAGSHLFDRFACPLGLHGAHRMCNWACNNAATLRMPAMRCPVYEPVVKPGRYTPKHAAPPGPSDSALPRLCAHYASLRREYTSIRMAQSLAAQHSILFSLPAELRNEIYNLVIHSALAHDATTTGVTEPRHLRMPHVMATLPAKAIDTQIPSACKPVPALLLTCKLIRKEAIELYTTAVDSELQKSVADIGIFWTDLGALSKEAHAKRWSVQAREAAKRWNSLQAAAIWRWCKALLVKGEGMRVQEWVEFQKKAASTSDGRSELKGSLTDLKMKSKASKTRQQPARSCKTKTASLLNYIPPLFHLPPELRVMIYELVAISTLDEARSLDIKPPPTTLAVCRVSQQLRLEAEPVWHNVLMTEIERAYDDIKGFWDVCDLVCKRFLWRLRNLPGSCNDGVTLRLSCIMDAFEMLIKERERWQQTEMVLSYEVSRERRGRWYKTEPDSQKLSAGR